MLTRFLTLVSVAIISGAVGTGVGMLIAPAKGKDTREKVSVFVERHGGTLKEGLEKGQQALGDVIEFVTTLIPPSSEAG